MYILNMKLYRTRFHRISQDVKPLELVSPQIPEDVKCEISPHEVGRNGEVTLHIFNAKRCKSSLV
jgi:hypothetical protein